MKYRIKKLLPSLPCLSLTVGHIFHFQKNPERCGLIWLDITPSNTEAVLGLLVTWNEKPGDYFWSKWPLPSGKQLTYISISPPCQSVDLESEISDTLWRLHLLKHIGDRGQRGAWCAGFCSPKRGEGAVKSSTYAKIR